MLDIIILNISLEALKDHVEDIDYAEKRMPNIVEKLLWKIQHSAIWSSTEKREISDSVKWRNQENFPEIKNTNF